MLLDVKNLHVHFRVRGHRINAVDGVSFTIARGETFGLVGESGCGKTTVGRAVLRLVRATSGQVIFDSQPVFGLRRGRLRKLRRQMQIVFQDPAGSLNPRMRVGEIVREPLLVHRLARGTQLQKQVEQLLFRCGLPKDAANRYPHEFSGGQRQRIAIARALSLQPRLIICDEPTSALDVSIQSQILNLLKDLQDEFGLSYLFISHDMAVVHHICHRIGVMLGGKIVEEGERDAVIRQPRHEYTRKLLAAVPDVTPKRGASQAAVAP